MRREIEPKFEDCRGCRFFNPRKEARICGRCDVGEHFAEADKETELTEADAWELFAGMISNED